MFHQKADMSDIKKLNYRTVLMFEKARVDHYA